MLAAFLPRILVPAKLSKKITTKLSMTLIKCNEVNNIALFVFPLPVAFVQCVVCSTVLEGWALSLAVPA